MADSRNASENGKIKKLAFFEDHAPGADDFMRDAIGGLSQARKTLPSKYLYDAEGSRLFDAICNTEDYYPTRTELSILDASGGAIAKEAGREASIVEFGAGAPLKARKLLNALDDPHGYVAVDISREQLIETACTIVKDFPALVVGGVCADFTQPLDMDYEDLKSAARRVGFLSGSTIGNLEPQEAVALLRTIRETLGTDGALLIGVDLKKDEKRLIAAYNDSEGVSAAFNLNILARMVRELDAGISCADFTHEALYNADVGRMEMHLRSRCAQTIQLNGHEFLFAKGESIHTESSYKYDVAGFREIASRAGFSPGEVWVDTDKLFSLHWLEVEGSRSA